VIYAALDNKLCVLGLFFDFSSAFDSVDHALLVRKLENLGFHGNVKSWVESYLSDRYQFVQVDGHKSEHLPNNVGVPQGSILGPFLFLLFINDLPDFCDSADKIILYVDDSNIIITAQSEDILKLKAERVITQMLSWSQSNGLLLNALKTNMVRFMPRNYKQ